LRWERGRPVRNSVRSTLNSSRTKTFRASRSVRTRRPRSQHG